MKPLQGKDGGRPLADPTTVNPIPDPDPTPPRRTRPPASVRNKERLAHEADLTRGKPAPSSSAASVLHSAPRVTVRKAAATDDEWMTAQLLKLRSGFAASALDQLEQTVQVIGDAGMRFDSEPLASHPGAADFRKTAALRSLQARGSNAVAARVAMRFIELGCDPNACDDMQSTVLMYAARFGQTDLVEFLLTDCPDIGLHRLNFYGQNAAMMAHAYGNTATLAALTAAGVMRNPPNAALIFYQSDRERFHGPQAHDAYTQFWRLLQHTHYINLADATGKTLIFHAVLNQDVDMVRFLCRRSDYPDLTVRDHQHQSVFDYAALIGDDEKRKDIMAALKDLRSVIRPLGDLRMQDH